MTEYDKDGNEKYIRCTCGLIVASSKMKMHQESEHFVKSLSDALRKKEDFRD